MNIMIMCLFLICIDPSWHPEECPEHDADISSKYATTFSIPITRWHKYQFTTTPASNRISTNNFTLRGRRLQLWKTEVRVVRVSTLQKHFHKNISLLHGIWCFIRELFAPFLSKSKWNQIILILIPWMFTSSKVISICTIIQLIYLDTIFIFYMFYFFKQIVFDFII